MLSLDEIVELESQNDGLLLESYDDLVELKGSQIDDSILENDWECKKDSLAAAKGLVRIWLSNGLRLWWVKQQISS